MTTHAASLDTAPHRQSWFRRFAAVSIAAVWALAFWTYFFVQSAGDGYHMRGFVMFPVGLGIVGSIFALQASDHLAWKLTPNKRCILGTLVLGLTLVLWMPVGFGLIVH